MSIFTRTQIACPGCGEPLDFEAVQSINADRTPALRERILDETFQRQTCPHCDTDFRLEPDFNYVEHDRRLWIAARPLSRLPWWPDEEARAAGLYELVYGSRGSAYMQGLGKTLRRRITFGWAAVREKLLADDLGLDDVALELCKAAVLRSSAGAPVGQGNELRLVAGDAQALVLGWIHASDESLGQTLRVARSLYEQVAADEEGAWAALRAEIGAGAFVDMNRLLVVPHEPLVEGAS